MGIQTAADATRRDGAGEMLPREGGRRSNHCRESRLGARGRTPLKGLNRQGLRSHSGTPGTTNDPKPLSVEAGNVDGLARLMSDDVDDSGRFMQDVGDELGRYIQYWVT